VEKYRNPHGQLKDNLFLPLFNTNFISKFEINAGKGICTILKHGVNLPSKMLFFNACTYKHQNSIVLFTLSYPSEVQG
jgi:hypothetical protein